MNDLQLIIILIILISIVIILYILYSKSKSKKIQVKVITFDLNNLIDNNDNPETQNIKKRNFKQSSTINGQLF